MKAKLNILAVLLLLCNLTNLSGQTTPTEWRYDASTLFEKGGTGWHDSGALTADSIYYGVSGGILTIRTKGYPANQQIAIKTAKTNLTVKPVMNIRLRGTSDSYCAIKVTPLTITNLAWNNADVMQQQLIDTDGKTFFDYHFDFPQPANQTYMTQIGGIMLWFMDAGNNSFLKGTWEIDEIVLGGELTPINGISNVKTNRFNIYPNPVVDRLNILGEGVENSKVEIYNILGEKVQIQELQTQSPFDVSRLKSGIYIAKIKLGNEVFSNSFVKK